MSLSAQEFKLLEMFLRNPQRVLTRESILLRLENRSDAYDRNIDVQMSRLRAKLRDSGRNPKLIRTMRGDGYITLRDQLAETAKGMNAILTQGLEFARSLRTEEPMTKVNLPSFLQSLADDYANLGRAVTFECDSALEANPQTGVLPARPLCLKRCMENLLTNA